MSTRPLFAACLVLGACSSSPSADRSATAVGPDGSDQNAAVGFAGGTASDTSVPGGGPPGIIDWNVLILGYQLGYDATNGEATSVFLDFGTGPVEIPPTMDLYLGDVNWFGDFNQTDQYCTISFPLSGAPGFVPPSDWQRLVLGFRHDPVANPVVTDCFDGVPGDLDAAYYGTDFHEYLESYGDWGVAVGEVDATSYGYLAPYLTTPELNPNHLLGGTFRMGAFFDPPKVEEAYGFGWEIDPNTFEVVLDVNYYLTALEYSSEVDLGLGQLGQAWYDVSSLYLYTFQ